MSRKEIKLEKPDKYEKEYRRMQRKSLYKDFYEELIAEYRISKKFQKSGIEVFPEINASKGARILGCPVSTIMRALHTRRLQGRRLPKETLIRIINLYEFGVFLEKKKMEKNKIRR